MNKVILIGRLARDPELRTTASGISMVRFTVAVNRRVNTQNGGQPQTDFIGCIAWRGQAENIARFCSKGSQVAVDGRIQTGSYDGTDGQKHYTTDIVADNVTFLGSRGDNNSSVSQMPQPIYPPISDVSAPQVMPYNESQSILSTDMPSTDVSNGPFEDFGEEFVVSDDDLPF